VLPTRSAAGVSMYYVVRIAKFQLPRRLVA
jgi:hypothetical protein